MRKVIGHIDQPSQRRWSLSGRGCSAGRPEVVVDEVPDLTPLGERCAREGDAFATLAVAFGDVFGFLAVRIEPDHV